METLTRQKVLELMLEQIDTVEMWGRDDDADLVLHYVCGVKEMAQSVLKAIDRAERQANEEEIEPEPTGKIGFCSRICEGVENAMKIAQRQEDDLK